MTILRVHKSSYIIHWYAGANLTIKWLLSNKSAMYMDRFMRA
jgi:hypothetical protein